MSSMQSFSNCNCHWLLFLLIVMAIGNVAQSSSQIDIDEDLKRLLGRCPTQAENFNDCMKDVLNDLRAYFTTGIPNYNISPFDPHYSPYVEIRRGDPHGLGSFSLILRNSSEFGWSRSEVTKFHADPEDQRIVYTQYFPEKSLEGQYEVKVQMLGADYKRKGFWNLTLYDYSQTTSVRRVGQPGSPIKVNVEVDKIGGMELHIDNLVKEQLNQLVDFVINSMWQLGLPFVRPMINELVSRAFTDIFNESFRYFPLEKFLSST